jgi:hypothetical protein
MATVKTSHDGKKLVERGRTSSLAEIFRQMLLALARRLYPPRLSGSRISRGGPRGSEVRGFFSCKKSASCGRSGSPADNIPSSNRQRAPRTHHGVAERSRKSRNLHITTTAVVHRWRFCSVGCLYGGDSSVGPLGGSRSSAPRDNVGFHRRSSVCKLTPDYHLRPIVTGEGAPIGTRVN